MAKKDKGLEDLVAEEILDYVKDCLGRKEKTAQIISGISETLREYSEEWANVYAHDWLIDHHP